MSTKTSILFLLLLSILSCRGHILTYEQYKKLEGIDFCAAKDGDLNQKLCVRLGERNKFTGFLIESLTFSECFDRTMRINNKDQAEYEEFTAKILECGYNRNDDGVEYEPPQRPHNVTQFRTRGLARGIGVNDVMEYKEYHKNREVKFVPEKNQTDLLKEVLYLEDHKNLEGENFCSSKNAADILPKLCIKIAKKHEIVISEGSVPFGKCFEKEIALLSKDTGKNETIIENMLFCMYNKKSDTENEEYIASKKAHRISKSEIRVLGSGKKAKDVIEYKLYKTDTYMPYENIDDFLSEY